MEIKTDTKNMSIDEQYDKFINEFIATKNRLEPMNNVDDAIPIWNEFMQTYQEYIMGNDTANKKVLEFVNTSELVQGIYKKFSNVEESSTEPTEEVVDVDVDVAQEKVLEKTYTEEEYNIVKNQVATLTSDFDNYRKRVAKEKIQSVKLSNEKLIIDLLVTLDNFDRASKSQGGLSDGIQLTYNKFIKTLESYGAKSFMVDGDKFDADTMYAVTKIPVEEDKKGTVVETVETGYMLGEKIIRFPKVIIGE